MPSIRGWCGKQPRSENIGCASRESYRFSDISEHRTSVQTNKNISAPDVTGLMPRHHNVFRRNTSNLSDQFYHIDGNLIADEMFGALVKARIHSRERFSVASQIGFPQVFIGRRSEHTC